MADGQLSAMIQELNTKLVQAFETRNFTAVAQMFTDDAMMLPPRRNMITGRGNIESFWSQAARIKELKFDTASVASLGVDAAREIGTLRMRVAPGRKRRGKGRDENGESGESAGAPPKEISGKYVFIWRKVGAHWKLETGIWNVTKQKEKEGRRGGKRKRAREQ